MTMALDDTIARDLAALAADARRGWRAADSLLADPPEAIDPSPLATISQVFARRAAWIASGAVTAVMMAMVVVSAVLLTPDTALGGVLANEHALAGRLGWVVVPALAAHALARQVAARWIAAALATSAAPVADGRRWLRRLDRAAIALALVTIALPAGLFGVSCGAIRADDASFVSDRTAILAEIAVDVLAALLITVTFAVRVRDQRRLAASPAPALALVPLHEAIGRRAAWLGAGIGALAGSGAVLILLAAASAGSRAGAYAWSLLLDALVSMPAVLAFALAGHILGARLSERMLDRRAASEPGAAMAALADRLTGWAVAAVAAGGAALVLIAALLRLVYAGGVSYAGAVVNVGSEAHLPLAAAAIALVVVLAISLARKPGDARLLCVLRHYVTPCYAVLILIGAGKLGWRLDWTAAGHGVVQLACTFGLAFAVFLLATWAGLNLTRRTPRSSSTPPRTAGLE